MAWAKKRPKVAPEPLDEKQLYEYAVASLGRRMRTVSQLKQLMRTKVEQGEAGASRIDAVVAKLKEYNFLDDAAFAATFTRLRQDNQSFGRRRVQQDLMQKGVPTDLATHALDTAYEDVNEEALARQHLTRKRLKQPTNDKEAARVMRQLMRAGFSSGTIFKILKSWDLSEGALSTLEETDSETDA
jgi:regulatory protein